MGNSLSREAEMSREIGASGEGGNIIYSSFFLSGKVTQSAVYR